MSDDFIDQAEKRDDTIKAQVLKLPPELTPNKSSPAPPDAPIPYDIELIRGKDVQLLELAEDLGLSPIQKNITTKLRRYGIIAQVGGVLGTAQGGALFNQQQLAIAIEIAVERLTPKNGSEIPVDDLTEIGKLIGYLTGKMNGANMNTAIIELRRLKVVGEKAAQIARPSFGVGEKVQGTTITAQNVQIVNQNHSNETHAVAESKQDVSLPVQAPGAEE